MQAATQRLASVERSAAVAGPLTLPCHRALPAVGRSSLWACSARQGFLARSRVQLSRAESLSASSTFQPAASSDSDSSTSTSSRASGGAAATTAAVAATNGGSQQQRQRITFGRKVLACTCALDAAELLAEEQGWQAGTGKLSEQDCQELINAALDKANVQLALSVHQAMCSARRPQSRSTSSSVDGAFEWPVASIQTTAALVVGLCRALATSEAMAVIREIRVQGMPRNEEIGFGKVVNSPLDPSRTLAVVQPQEGSKVVADAYSRYEYELFSGRVVSCSSDALQPPPGGLLGLALAAARSVGLIGTPPRAAVHTMVVQAPDGQSRTFRAATELSDVPAQVNDRITLVCAPRPGARTKKRGFLSASPPGVQPGQAMSCTNHNTGAMVRLLLAPPSGQNGADIPSWYVPAAVVLAGSDAVSSMVDPTMPLLITAGAVAAVGSAVASNKVLLPALKQLPNSSVQVEYIRQRLLGEYASLASKVDVVMQENAEDVRVLARLWQLQNKMESVVGVTSAGYQNRIERVASARSNIEQRLAQRLELLEGYSRVMAMIEIEVEMDSELPAAEVEGIEMQIVRLRELELLQDDWKAQAEARDEVEKLLRSA